METTAEPEAEPEVASTLRRRFGELRRQIRRLDLRAEIVNHPFAAVGIGAVAGALIGLVRPARSRVRERGRVSSAFVATLSAIGYRVLKDVAFAQLGGYAKQWLAQQQNQGQQNRSTAHAPVESDESYRIPF